MPQAASWMGSPSIKGSTESVRMGLLTFSHIGLQFTWGIEMTYCTPYLLDLGLTKANTSLVWVAGPLSGLVMQPVVGVLADRSRSKWGRRRPFMVFGSFVVAFCLLLLGWTAEIVGFFVNGDETTRKMATIVLAVFAIYGVDFAINAVMSTSRSLIVDTLAIPDQQLGSAWASRMTSVGSLAGYAVGSIDLVTLLGPALGDTQFKQACVISAITLLCCIGITCWAVEERVLISPPDESEKSGSFKIVSQIFHTALHLPDRIRGICWAQFWAWIGWFPFLFYSTTWVGELYFMSLPPTDNSTSSDHLGALGRVGSLSLVVFSIITFLSSVILPHLVRGPTTHASRPFTPRPPASLAPAIESLRRYCPPSMMRKPTLLTAWVGAHVIFASTMIFAPWVSSYEAASVLVAMCGVPWTLACWAPFTFMGEEINRLSVTEPAYRGVPRRSVELELELGEIDEPRSSVSPEMLHLRHEDSESSEDEGWDSEHHGATATPRRMSRARARAGTATATETVTDGDESSTGELSGIYLGILNLFTTLPQFVGTFTSSLVFWLMEPQTGGLVGAEEGPAVDESGRGIGVCLFIGACCAVVAAAMTARLRKLGL